MTSNKKKWFLFLNILLNLGLSGSLLAFDKTDTDDSSNESTDTESDTHNNNSSTDSNTSNEPSLEEIILNEKLLIDEYTAQELLNEEIFLEQLNIADHFHSQILSEDELLLQMLDAEIMQQNFAAEVKAQDVKTVASGTSKQIHKQSISDEQWKLAFDSVFTENDNSREKLLRILAVSKKRQESLPTYELSRLSSETKNAIKERLELAKLAQFKAEVKDLYTQNAAEVNKEKSNYERQENNINQLLAFKKEALFLADRSAQGSTHLDINRNTKTHHAINDVNQINPSVIAPVNLLPSDLKADQSTLEKLASLKNIAAELSTQSIDKDLTRVTDTEIEKSNISKLSSLKKLAIDLSAEKNSIPTHSSNQKVYKNKLEQHLQASNINTKSLARASGEKDYILVSNRAATSAPTLSASMQSGRQSIEEDISMGATVGAGRPVNEAEMEQINTIIAPDLENIEFNPDATELLLVDARMNKKDELVSTVIAFNQTSKEIYTPLETIEQWNIEGPFPEAVEIQGQKLIPLHDMHTVNASFNRSELILDLSLPSAAFGSQQLSLSAPTVIPNAFSDRGMFLNYDSLYSKSDQNGGSYNMLLSPVVFSEFGFLSSRFRFNANPGVNQSKLTRFETFFQKDIPKRMTTLRVGDAVTRGGSFGGNTAFTGVQYGTNFSTVPTFTTTPLPYLFSETTAPSTIDIFVNDNFVRQVDVEPGPFEIQNIPSVNGDGQIQFVIKDELGRERIVSTNFYANRSLLKPGITDYSYSLGVLRENIGRDNAGYGSSVGVVDLRRGITNSLTLGTTGEFSKDVNNLGISADYTLGKFGTLSSSFALSAHDSTKAKSFNLGYGFSTSRFNVSGSLQTADEGFRNLGQSNPSKERTQYGISAGLNLSRFGSLGLSHVTQQLPDDTRTINSLSYSKVFNNKHSVSLYASQSKDEIFDNDMQYGVSFSTSFKNDASFDTSWSKSINSSQLSSSYQNRSHELLKPSYRIRTDRNQSTLPGGNTAEQRASEAFLATRTQYFDVNTRLDRRNDSSAYQVGLNGGFAYLNGGYWGFTRNISNSFAVVKVADFNNVGVFKQNRFIGRTNNRGYMIAPGLTPYHDNKITFDPLEVPLDTTFKTDQSKVIPFARSGLLVDFDIQRSTSYSFTAMSENGQYLPLGQDIMIDDDHSSIVGYDGLVFVQVPDDISKITIGKGQNACTITLPVNSAPDSVTNIISTEKLTCKK